jgi:iron-sulfur cluster repair protein YtfE (RIC family)
MTNFLKKSLHNYHSKNKNQLKENSFYSQKINKLDSKNKLFSAQKWITKYKKKNIISYKNKNLIFPNINKTSYNKSFFFNHI